MEYFRTYGPLFLLAVTTLFVAILSGMQWVPSLSTATTATMQLWFAFL
jgi:hypothetical protein